MGASTVLSLLSGFKSGNHKVAEFIEETIENTAKKSDLKSIISMDEASLRAAALLSDERIKEGRAGRLEGLPLIIKDNIDTSELITSGGTAAFKDAAKENSPPLQRLLSEGSIAAAKSSALIALAARLLCALA